MIPNRPVFTQRELWARCSRGVGDGHGGRAGPGRGWGLGSLPLSPPSGCASHSLTSPGLRFLTCERRGGVGMGSMLLLPNWIFCGSPFAHVHQWRWVIVAVPQGLLCPTAGGWSAEPWARGSHVGPQPCAWSGGTHGLSDPDLPVCLTGNSLSRFGTLIIH